MLFVNGPEGRMVLTSSKWDQGSRARGTVRGARTEDSASEGGGQRVGGV